jgi:hypothetical protein
LDTVLKHVTSPQPTGDIQALLPPFVLPALPVSDLLQPTIVLEGFIVVMIIKVDAQCIPYSPGDNAPSALPVV